MSAAAPFAAFLDVLYGALALLLTGLDLLCGLCTRVPLAPPIKSVEVGGPPPPGEGRVRRPPPMAGRDLEAHAARKGATLPALLEYAVGRYRHRVAFSWRPVLSTFGKGANPINVLGRPQQLTYGDFHARVTLCAAGLVALGLRPGDVVAFWEDTCVEWVLVAHAAWAAGLVITTVYANLGPSALAFALRQTEAKVVFTHARAVGGVVAIPDAPALAAVVFRGRLEDHPLEGPLRVLSVAELEAEGRGSAVVPPRLGPDDLACIMYTSGTTGDPKGVLLSHRNLIAGIVGMMDRMGEGDDLQGQPVVHFLPLAHIYSLVILHVSLLGGAMSALSCAAQLTDTFTQPHGDLREYRPVFFIAVPRVYDVFKKTIEARVAQKSPLARRLFDAAYAARARALAGGRDTPLWNRLVFQPVREIFGGRLKIAYSGGAPINPKTQAFVTVVVGVALQQGYGLTETTACLAVQMVNDLSLGNVGSVHDMCEVKLVDIPEMGYHTSDRPCPRGEVYARGPVVASGYHRMPALTAEVFRPGGWFATGDVGTWRPDGALQIIDRRKNIVKLAMGEYVALEKLEALYSGVRFVAANGVCVVARSDKMFLVALILVNRDAVLHWAKSEGLKATDTRALLDHPALRRAVSEALAQEAASCDLKPFEQIARFRLYDDVWIPETGMLTAAMKLQRRNIEAHYRADIDALYL